jgi:hypothetical protein
MAGTGAEVNMTETGPVLGPDSFGVEIEDFEAVRKDGGVGGGVTVGQDEVIGVVDGEELRNVVDTSPRVADIMGQGIDDLPFGEEV